MLIVMFYIALALAIYVSGERPYRPGEVSILDMNDALLVSDDEIVSVDWNSQSYKITDSAYSRLANLRPASKTLKFRIMVDSHVVSVGSFVSPNTPFWPIVKTSICIALPANAEGNQPIVILTPHKGSEPHTKHSTRLYEALAQKEKLAE